MSSVTGSAGNETLSGVMLLGMMGGGRAVIGMEARYVSTSGMNVSRVTLPACHSHMKVTQSCRNVKCAARSNVH